MGWDHGYHTQTIYTAHFHSEMAPNWLDFAALVKGHTPPRRREGSPFRYLELGSGMGFGLCLLAALYPEGRFTGIDFHPDHIAHSRQLAEELGLENVRFREADFLDLQDDPSPLGFSGAEQGIYHYVVAHGIATWVSEPVQRALLAVASAALLPGAIFYCSYNTFPGWLPLTAYQQLTRLELRRGETALPAEALQRSSNMLLGLLGTEESPTHLRILLPTLAKELEDQRMDNLPYMLGEYGCDNWQPLYVAEMHERCATHKLSPVGTANLPELFDELLPQPLRSQVSEEPNPLIRQTLIDVGCGRSFRRDLFARGSSGLSKEAWQRRLASLSVRRRETPPRADWKFSTSLGDLGVSAEACESFEAALASGPRTLMELAEAIRQPTVEALRLAALLLHDDRLGLDRGEAGKLAQDNCDRVNARLLQRLGEGWPYDSLAAPTIGTGVVVNLVEALCCLAPGQGPLRGEDEQWLQARLSELGAGQGQSGQGGYDFNEERGKRVHRFQHERLAALQELGVFLARFQPRSPGHGQPF